MQTILIYLNGIWMFYHTQRNTVGEHFTGIHSINLAVVYGCVLLRFCFKSGIFECYLIIWLTAFQTTRY